MRKLRHQLFAHNSRDHGFPPLWSWLAGPGPQAPKKSPGWRTRSCPNQELVAEPLDAGGALRPGPARGPTPPMAPNFDV